MKFYENSRLSRPASKNFSRCEFHFTSCSIFLDNIGEKLFRLTNRMRVHSHRLTSYLTFSSVSVPMGIIRAIPWFLIERNTVKRFRHYGCLPVAAAVPNPPQAAGKQIPRKATSATLKGDIAKPA